MRVPDLIPLSHIVQCIRFRLPMEAGNRSRTDGRSLGPGRPAIRDARLGKARRQLSSFLSPNLSLTLTAVGNAKADMAVESGWF